VARIRGGGGGAELLGGTISVLVRRSFPERYFLFLARRRGQQALSCPREPPPISTPGPPVTLVRSVTPAGGTVELALRACAFLPARERAVASANSQVPTHTSKKLEHALSHLFRFPIRAEAPEGPEARITGPGGGGGETIRKPTIFDRRRPVSFGFHRGRLGEGLRTL